MPIYGDELTLTQQLGRAFPWVRFPGNRGLKLAVLPDQQEHLF